MNNKVFLDNSGLIEQIYVGNQTGQTITQVANKTKEIIQLLLTNEEPIIVLVDLSKLGKSTSDSRKAALEALKNTTYDKVALFGLSPYTKYLSSFIIAASGNGSRVKLFDTKQKAKKWLTDGLPIDPK